MKYADINKIYENLSLEKIPWDSAAPPDELVMLVQSGKIRPCKTVDLGCGAGNYAIYLAGLGFDVTGIDSAPKAVQLAEENAQKRGAECTFIVADLLGDMHEVKETFDFAYDWEVLHHIFPKDREKYVKNVHTILNPHALYLSVCFSEKDPQFGGKEKFRKTPIGTTLYFSSEAELRDLFSPYYAIRVLKTIEVSGKYGPHCAIYVLMDRD
jgi:cyclopropane fatty-acyl-phospholipid synthase-like methyltransferase